MKITSEKVLQPRTIHVQSESGTGACINDKRDRLKVVTQLQTLSPEVVQRHIGTEIEWDIPVFKNAPGINAPGWDRNIINFLYSVKDYSRADILQSPICKVQMDHGGTTNMLNDINESYKYSNKLLKQRGALVIPEFVIGGDNGVDETDPEQFRVFKETLHSVSRFISEATQIMKGGEILEHGGVCFGIPYNKMLKMPKPQLAMLYYAAPLQQLTDSVYVQLTAGINPMHVREFAYPINGNPFADKERSLLQLSVFLDRNLIECGGLHAYCEQQFRYAGQSNTPDLRRNACIQLLNNFIYLILQEISSRFLRHTKLGNFENQMGSTAKNTVYMLPQVPLGKILTEAFPVSDDLNFLFHADSLNQFMVQYCIEQADLFKKFCGATRNPAFNPDLIIPYIRSIVSSTVRDFTKNTPTDEGMSVHDFVFHKIKADDPSAGRLIPVEFRHLAGNRLPADQLVGYFENLIGTLRKINKR